MKGLIILECLQDVLFAIFRCHGFETRVVFEEVHVNKYVACPFVTYESSERDYELEGSIRKIRNGGSKNTVQSRLQVGDVCVE